MPCSGLMQRKHLQIHNVRVVMIMTDIHSGNTTTKLTYIAESLLAAANNDIVNSFTIMNEPSRFSIAAFS